MRILPVLVFIFFVGIVQWPSSAQAISFLSFDPRTMAMGGSGTATAVPSHSGVFNPALLANHEYEENQMFAQGFAGIRIMDREHFIDRAESLEEKDAEYNIDESVETIFRDFEKQKLKAKDIYKTTDEIRGFLKDIKDLSDKPLRVGASAGFSTGVQGREVSYALTQRRYMVLGAVVDIDRVDVLRINQMLRTYDAIAGVMLSGDTLEQFTENSGYDEIQETIRQDAANNEVSEELLAYQDIPKVNTVIVAMQNFQFDVEELDQYIDLESLYEAIEAQENGGGDSSDVDIRDYFRYQLPENFASTLNFSGAEITESFISFAKNYERYRNLSLGLNIKYQDIEVIGLSQKLNKINFDAYKRDRHRFEYQKINFDMGLSYPISENWMAGFIVKNMIHHTLKAPHGPPIRLEPIYRGAIAFNNKRWTWALDVDFTRNEPLGFDPDKRYLTTGVEWRPFEKSAFRAGYRYNTVDQSGMPSIGMGAGYGRVFTDIAFTTSDIKTELGAAAQIRIEL